MEVQVVLLVLLTGSIILVNWLLAIEMKKIMSKKFDMTGDDANNLPPGWWGYYYEACYAISGALVMFFAVSGAIVSTIVTMAIIITELLMGVVG